MSDEESRREFCHFCGSSNTYLTPCGHQKLAAFEICLEKWLECKTEQACCRTDATKESPTLYSRKHEEFIADFERIVKKAADEGWERDYLRLAFGEKISAKDARATRQGTSRLRERILKEKLGASLMCIEPYLVYPPIAYFNAPIKTALKSHVEHQLKRMRAK